MSSTTRREGTSRKEETSSKSQLPLLTSPSKPENAGIPHSDRSQRESRPERGDRDATRRTSKESGKTSIKDMQGENGIKEKTGKETSGGRSRETQNGAVANSTRIGSKDKERKLKRSSKEEKGKVERAAQQTTVRMVALCESSDISAFIARFGTDLYADLVPVLFSIPLSLILALIRAVLTPLYNSIPLSLHPRLIYVLPLLLPVFIYWRFTSRVSAQEIISARVCLGISALAVDLVAVGGRRVGSTLGELLGAKFGALASLSILATGVVGGGLCFALLCFVSPGRSSGAQLG